MGTTEYELLDAKAFAARTGCSLASAYRAFETMKARQSVPGVLRLVETPVTIGSGATRLKAQVCWPVGRPAAVANDNAVAR